MRAAPDGDGEVYIAGGAVTSFLNASYRGAGTGELHPRNCSGRSLRWTLAAVAAVGGEPAEAWTAWPGCGKRRLAKNRDGGGWESGTGSGEMAVAPEL